MEISINIPEFFSNYFKNNKKIQYLQNIYLFIKKKTNFMSHNPLINKNQIITIL